MAVNDSLDRSPAKSFYEPPKTTVKGLEASIDAAPRHIMDDWFTQVTQAIGAQKLDLKTKLNC